MEFKIDRIVVGLGKGTKTVFISQVFVALAFLTLIAYGMFSLPLSVAYAGIVFAVIGLLLTDKRN